MFRRFRSAAAAAAIVAAFATPAARADMVTQWNATAVGTATPAHAQAAVVSLAITHAAVYDAVNAIAGGHQPYLTRPEASPLDSKDAAAATAAYRVLFTLFPSGTLTTQYNASLATIPDGPAKTGGIAVGEAAAAAMLTARATDGRLGPFRFTPRFGAGEWRAVLPLFVNDPNAWLRDVTTFTIGDPREYLSNGPHALTSSAYAAEFDEVKSLGSAASTTRTGDQTNAARFWAVNPPGTWARVARMLATQEALAIEDSARLFAMLHTAQADALIAVWNDKAEWSNWRPITAIREAESDGNAATTADATWLPLIATPPYPEHSSGASAIAGASAGALQDVFGTGKLEWTDTNNAVTRSYTSFHQAAKEVVEARIWSGIHFRAADQAGWLIGRKTQQFGGKHFFQAIR